jgi:hypothetical protein
VRNLLAENVDIGGTVRDACMHLKRRKNVTFIGLRSSAVLFYLLCYMPTVSLGAMLSKLVKAVPGDFNTTMFWADFMIL